MKSVFEDLRTRGCIHDVSNEQELQQLLATEKLSFYCGFDPTADSLHVGHMLPLLLMRRMQQAGHRPIALLGTATAMIGDPSGKSEERKVLSEDVIQANTEAIARQVAVILDSSGSNPFEMVRNDQWLRELGLIDFLRDVGRHFSVNAMIAKDSVKSRLENREQGISYTEFSYMMLQAYDFYWLNQHRGCRLQVGGSDQWGNITAGLELIRRRGPKDGKEVFGCTFPLLTTARGTKFGKTESGAVWLDPKRTSAYRFYQFWKSSEDADVIRYLKLFTDIPLEEIAELELKTREEPQARAAQIALARSLTRLVHGPSECERAERASQVLFGGSIRDVDAHTLEDIFSDVPSSTITQDALAAGLSLVDFLVSAGVAASKSAARRSIEAGGIYVNSERVQDLNAVVSSADALEGRVLIVRSGKKSYHLVKIEG